MQRATPTRCSASSTPSRPRRRPRLSALAAGDRAQFEAILAPTVPLSRHIFAAPTRFYKTGVVFMAWLNGHQPHFTMVGGQQSARSIVHLARDVPAGRRRGPACATPSWRRRGCAALLARAIGVGAVEQRRMSEPDGNLLSLNTATVREAVAAARHHRRLRPARHPRHLAVARPGRGRRIEGGRRSAFATPDSTVTGYCRGGMFPALGPRRPRAPRSTTTSARSTKR